MLFKETPEFKKDVREFMRDDEYLEIQKFLLNNPKYGKGKGGIRIFHWSLDRHGKKSDITIFYQYFAQETFVMLRAVHPPAGS